MVVYLGIDVGILNLALVKCQVEDYQMVTLLDARCVNLNELAHHVVPRDQCRLQHSNDVYDKLQHLFQEHSDIFSGVDQVRIERQPLGGLVHVEQLLFGHFRDKAKLISPNAMHKHFDIRMYDYDGRKIQTTRIAEPYLAHMAEFQQRERVHDLADAVCILLYSLCAEQREYNAKLAEERKKQEQQQRQQEQLELYGPPAPVVQFFNQFRYHPPNAKNTSIPGMMIHVGMTSGLTNVCPSTSPIVISAKEWLQQK